MAGNSVAQYIIELIFKSSGTQKVLADTRQLEKVVRDYNVRAKELGKSISPKISETESWQFEYYKKALQAAGLTKYKPVLTSKGKIRWASSTGFVSKEEAASYRAFLVALNTQTAKYDSTLAHLTRVEEKAIAAQKAHSAATYRLMKRSLQIIPIWFFMRQAFMLVINAVGDVIRTFGELENEMGRVGTVTRGFSEDNTRALEILKKAILDYSATASRGFKEAAQVMYAIGSAGLTVREQLGGMQHIMDLTIGTFSNAEQVAKLVAGAYNVFGKSMEGAYSAAAKMKRISDVLAYVYSSQQVELSQISDAMTYVASTASLMDISFTELVTTIGVLNTGLLRGSKSGTSLLNAFAQLAKQGGGLAKLDIYFDPSKPLNFSKIMDQLHKKFGDTALSASNLRILMDTFGRRGGRAVAQLISRYDEWQKSIEKTKSSFEDFALYMRVQAEDTLPKAFKKMWNEIKAKGLTQGSGLMDYIKNNILYTDILYNKLAKLRNLNVTPSLNKAINELYSSFASLKHPTIISKRDLMNIYKIIGALQSEASVMYDLKEGLRMAAGVPSTMNIKSSADMLNTVLERVNKITDAKEREKKLEEELKVFVAYRLPMLEKDREGRKYINKLIAEREKKEGKFTNNLEKENYIINKIVTHYKEVLKQQNKIKTVTTGIDAEFKKQLEDLQKARRLSILQAEGAKQYTLHQRKIKDIINDINDAIDVRNEKEKDKIAHLQPQDIYNHKKLLEIASKISDQKKNLNDLYKEGTKLIADEVKEITKYSDELKSAFSKGFQDVFSGKIGLGGLFKQASAKYREIFSKAFSEGLTDQLFAMTGLDKLFGSQMYIFRHALEGPTGKIKAAFDYGATKTYNAIVSGFNRSMGTGKGIGGFAVSTTGFTAGAGGFGGYNLPGFGAGGFFNRAVWGLTYRNATERAMAARMGHPQAPTYGQLLGFGMNTAMAVQGGLSTGTAAGVMGGLGSLMMGGAGINLFAGSAGMLGALGGLLGPIGFALAIGSLIAGSLSSPPKWRREEERTTTKEITSRIDVTNKQLEWVNRNLVALRQELTYIMPSSYYFRERPENEKFAIDAGRGT